METVLPSRPVVPNGLVGPTTHPAQSSGQLDLDVSVDCPLPVSSLDQSTAPTTIGTVAEAHHTVAPSIEGRNCFVAGAPISPPSTIGQVDIKVGDFSRAQLREEIRAVFGEFVKQIASFIERQV